MTKRQKYHFLVIKEHSTGRSVLTLPGQTKGFRQVSPWVLVKDNCPDKALTKARKSLPTGTVLITSTLRDRFGYYDVKDCFTIDGVPVENNDAIAAWREYFSCHEMPSVPDAERRPRKGFEPMIMDDDELPDAEDPEPPVRKGPRRLYALVTWPDCQYLMEVQGFHDFCHLVVPAGRAELDQAYMVPDGFAGVKAEAHECYERFDFPESQEYGGRSPGALSDYDGNIYIPVYQL